MSNSLVEREETLLGLEQLERRVLWLSSLIVHEANLRKDTHGVKVGGHQASSASCVGILTALYFQHLTSVDRIAVKPHASPVLYAIQYLLDRIPRHQLRLLRAFGGLQAYPSQTKAPEYVDYSTGSVGLGAAAINFSALTAQFLRSRGHLEEVGRFWAVVGDAELDEGNVWEALAEPLLDDVPGIRWVIDLNRQSLDRVVPGMRVSRLEKLFAANGWRVIEAKYGRVLTGLFAQPNGDLFRSRIDAMSNEEYQSIISGPEEEIANRLAGGSLDRSAVDRLLGDVPPSELRRTLTSLGGHDQEALATALRKADAELSPAVVFAYTIKGWGLPFAGDPLNHSALMNQEQMESLASRLEIGDDWYAKPDPDSPEGRILRGAYNRLRRIPQVETSDVTVPADLNTRGASSTSSQEIFGRALATLAKDHPELAGRVVTVAPDVSISTSLAGWINRVGSWRINPTPEYGDPSPLLRWEESPGGQHMELGISEMNLFGLLSQLGLSRTTFGHVLIPIGTVYDTFISRGLDALIYGLYCGSSFVLVGTPSGVSLAPEGGAHQSTFTPGLGITLPGLVSYEPCYAKEVEWVLIEAIRRALNQSGSTYLRLSTIPIDQTRFPSDDPTIRNKVLHGAYRIIDRREEVGYSPHDAVLIFATGVTVPEACRASDHLLEEGVFASVINVTSADRLFNSWNAEAIATIEMAQHQPNPFPDLLSRDEADIPAVIVADGHPHNLSFLGTALEVPSISVGVVGFGESGTVEDLYRKHHLDPESLTNAAIALVDRGHRRRGE